MGIQKITWMGIQRITWMGIQRIAFVGKIGQVGSVRRKTGVAGLEFEAGHGYEWLTQAACLSSHFLSGQDEWVRGGGVGRKGGVGGVWRQTQLFIPATFPAP